MRLNYTKQNISALNSIQLNPDVTELNLSHNNISDLAPLKRLKKLQKLNLEANAIRSIFPLKLSKLNELNLSRNQLSDLEYFNRLISLQKLDLRNNKIENVATLSQLKQLRELNLFENRLYDCKELNKLTKLESLILTFNHLSKIENVDKLTNLKVLGWGANGVAEIEGLDKLTKLQRLYLGNNSISEIKGLDKLIKLEELNLRLNKICDITGLDKLQNLRELDLSHNKISEIKGLEKLGRLQQLCLDENRISKIKCLDNLTQLRTLSLVGNRLAEIKGLDNLINLETVDFAFNKLKVNCLETLLRYKKERNLPKLKAVSLSDNKIDWFDVKAGNYAYELRKLSVDIHGEKVQYIPPEKEESSRLYLPDYLSKVLKLKDEDIQSIFDWFKKGNEFDKIGKVSQSSFHKPLKVETRDGRKIILKISSNKFQAEVEQAANYYLSRAGFKFIVPSDQNRPFEFSGLYLTVQNDMSPVSGVMLLSQHLACLAKIHVKGKTVFESAGIIIPKLVIPDFGKLYETIRYLAHRHPDVSRTRIFERGREYDEYKQMFNEEGNDVLLHGDPKVQNTLEKYLLDLERMCTGDESMDLARVLNDPKMILYEDQKRAFIRLYQHFVVKGKNPEEKNIAVREDDVEALLEKVKKATLITGMESIDWNLDHIYIEGETAREKLSCMMNALKKLNTTQSKG